VGRSGRTAPPFVAGLLLAPALLVLPPALLVLPPALLVLAELLAGLAEVLLAEILLTLTPLLLAERAGRHCIVVNVDEDASPVRSASLQHILVDTLDLREAGLPQSVFQLLLTELLARLPALPCEALLILLPAPLAELLLLILPLPVLLLLSKLLRLPVALPVLLSELLTLLILLPGLLTELLPLLILPLPVLLLSELLRLLAALPVLLLLAELLALLILLPGLLLPYLHALVFLDLVELRATFLGGLLRSGDLPVLNLRHDLVVPYGDPSERKQIDAIAVAAFDFDEFLPVPPDDAGHRADLLILLIDDLPVEKVGNAHLPQLTLLRLHLALLRLTCLGLARLGLAGLLRDGSGSNAKHQGCGQGQESFLCHDVPPLYCYVVIQKWNDATTRGDKSSWGRLFLVIFINTSSSTQAYT
jgi:hypothetical protein